MQVKKIWMFHHEQLWIYFCLLLWYSVFIQSCHLLFPTRRLRTFFPLKGILKSLWFYQVWKSSEVKIHSGKSPQIDFKLHPAVFACWRSTGWSLAKKRQLLRYANILYGSNQLHIVRWHFFAKLQLVDLQQFKICSVLAVFAKCSQIFYILAAQDCVFLN